MPQIDRINLEIPADLPTYEGNCFEVAAKLVLAGTLTRAKVVHGLPIGQGQDNLSKRYWHAWVVMRYGAEPIVVDLSNGKQTALLRREYYRIGQIEKTWEYTARQVRENAWRLDSWGPWVQGWEEMED